MFRSYQVRCIAYLGFNNMLSYTKDHAQLHVTEGSTMPQRRASIEAADPLSFPKYEQSRLPCLFLVIPERLASVRHVMA